MPNPALATVTTGATALETAFNTAEAIREQAKQKTLLQNQSEDALDLQLTNLAAYVQNATNGDAVKIESAAMSVKSPKTPPQVPVQVTNLGVTRGDNSGEVDLHWHSLANAKSYVVQTSPDPFTEASWAVVAAVTKSKAEVLNQPVGQRRWYRVAAVGSAGQGAYSQPVLIVVGN